MPDGRRIEERRRQRDSYGRAFRPALRQNELPGFTDGGQRSTLRHAMATSLTKNDVGRCRQTRPFRLEACGIEEARGNAEMATQCMDGRLRRLEIDGGDAGERQR